MSIKRQIAGLILGAAVGAGAVSNAFAAEKKVGISIPEAQNPFYVLLGKSISAGLQEHGIEPVLLSADADVNEQINNINDLIAAQVNLIIMSPMNLEGPAPAVQAANDAGIPVVMIARRLADQYQHLWEAFVGFDLAKVGSLKGQWVVENLEPGKIAMLLGPAGALFSVEQERGFREVAEPAGFEVVWTQNSTQTRENGLQLAEDALVANPDLIVIYGSNDDLALGAAQAVKAAGLSDQVSVLGTNGIPPAIAAIHRGDMAATVLLDPVAWGRLGAKTAAEILEGKKPESQFVEFQSELVTSDNACSKMPPPLKEEFGMGGC